ncbi:MAG TPA: isoprenylcysteine carboxylmethyltransferase family protein [Actinomycetota bacterium]
MCSMASSCCRWRRNSSAGSRYFANESGTRSIHTGLRRGLARGRLRVGVPCCGTSAVGVRGRLAEHRCRPRDRRLGVVLRSWAIVTLGRIFTYDVTIQPGHRVVTSGPYRWAGCWGYSVSGSRWEAARPSWRSSSYPSSNC